MYVGFAALSNLITNLANVDGFVMGLCASKKGSCLWCQSLAILLR